MFQRLITKLGLRKSGENGFAKISFSQCGEDSIVRYIFNLRGITNPTYIDIGAHHPFYLSNTAVFYEAGSRGINIEANPNLIEDFKVHRPLDINLNLGVGGNTSELELFVINDASLSTFSEEEANNVVSNGKYQIVEKRKISIDTIENILNRYNSGIFPDFLSLDVEGFDFEILSSIDFNKYWPKIICVEAAEYSPIGAGRRKSELIDFIISKGYYEYANTNLNSILIKNEFWFI